VTYASFGRAPAPELAEEPLPPPSGPPSIGELYADLVLVPTVDRDALVRVGEEIASVIAAAVHAGFERGIRASQGE
jgi:hypothetical protein